MQESTPPKRVWAAGQASGNPAWSEGSTGALRGVPETPKGAGGGKEQEVLKAFTWGGDQKQQGRLGGLPSRSEEMEAGKEGSRGQGGSNRARSWKRRENAGKERERGGSRTAAPSPRCRGQQDNPSLCCCPGRESHTEAITARSASPVAPSPL